MSSGRISQRTRIGALREQQRRLEASKITLVSTLQQRTDGKVVLIEYVNNKKVTVSCEEHGEWTTELRRIYESACCCRLCSKKS